MTRQPSSNSTLEEAALLAYSRRRPLGRLIGFGLPFGCGVDFVFNSGSMIDCTFTGTVDDVIDNITTTAGNMSD